MWSVLQLISYIYRIKPTSCQNNQVKSLLWMHLHQFQYLSPNVDRILSLWSIHWENSPVTQSTPEPTLLSWGRWPFEKIFPHHVANLVLSCLLVHSDPIFVEPFDVTQVCHECQICLRFHLIWKMILEMTFSAHYSLIWKLNGISKTSIS